MEPLLKNRPRIECSKRSGHFLCENLGLSQACVPSPFMWGRSCGGGDLCHKQIQLLSLPTWEGTIHPRNTFTYFQLFTNVLSHLPHSHLPLGPALSFLPRHLTATEPPSGKGGSSRIVCEAKVSCRPHSQVPAFSQTLSSRPRDK